MKYLTESDVVFEIIVENEPNSIEKELSFETTGADHSEYIQKVQQDQGDNPWLWCTVEVKAYYKSMTGSDYLGGCTFQSKEDFIAGGYYGQMKEEALENLNNSIQDLVTDLI